jgi:hypothetical protein
MADWVTISALATAGGTLVLAVATFSSVKSGNRSARVAERSLLAGLRPVLIPSREQDPVERLRFGDGEVVIVPGHGAAIQEHDGVIYLALALRNGGSGLAVIHGWRARRRQDSVHGGARSEGAPDDVRNGARSEPAPPLDEFRQQQIDLYIPAGDSGYWIGALRDPELESYEEVRAAEEAGDPVQIDLVYGDHEGGQRAIARFVASEWPDEDDHKPTAGAQRATVIRYWNLDRGDPR